MNVLVVYSLLCHAMAICLFTFVLKKEEMREIHLICVVYCWCVLMFYLYLHRYISKRQRYVIIVLFKQYITIT